MAEIPQEAREILDKKSLAHVATLNADGSPQVTPVWISTENGNVAINSAEGRLKPDNLRRDPRVSISVTDPENDYKPVLIRGRATEITHEGADEHIDELAKKYLGEDEYPFRQPGEERVKIVIEPEKVSVGQ
jgi:PPOX class probable F420-dependent enzyme